VCKRKLEAGIQARALRSKRNWGRASVEHEHPGAGTAHNGALRRLGYEGKTTAHGFRSTASSLLNESGKWNPDAIERALAH